VKVIAKGKSLLSQTSSKPKKQDKYDETSSIVKEYEFNIDDRVIFLGLVSDYRGLECTIIKRNMKKKTTDYYIVKFDDGKIIESVVYGFLRTPEQYELELSQNENESEDNVEMSDEELKVIENGYVPYKNRLSCYSQLDFYHRNCGECTHRHQCIYRFKGIYDKIKF